MKIYSLIYTCFQVLSRDASLLQRKKAMNPAANLCFFAIVGPIHPAKNVKIPKNEKMVKEAKKRTKKGDNNWFDILRC